MLETFTHVSMQLQIYFRQVATYNGWKLRKAYEGKAAKKNAPNVKYDILTFQRAIQKSDDALEKRRILAGSDLSSYKSITGIQSRNCLIRLQKCITVQGP